MMKFGQWQLRILAIVLLTSSFACSGSPVQPANPSSSRPVDAALPETTVEAATAGPMIEFGNKFDTFRRDLESMVFAADRSVRAEELGSQCKGRQKDGLPIGSWVCTSSDGKKTSVARYSKGRLDGWARTWFSNGKVQLEAFWKKGVLNGPATRYFPSGKPAVSAIFENGVLHGRWIERDEQGRKTWSYHFVEGFRNGRAREFHPNGFIKTRGHFHNGKKVGSYTQWYESGNIKLHGEYRDDRPVGHWQLWQDDKQASPRSGTYEEVTPGENLQW